MKTTTYIRCETESLDDISSLLQGRVFHVTKLIYLSGILASGEIRPNMDCSLPTTFGYLANGFFRKRNCVSLFDYRSPATDKIRDYRARCWPFQPAHDGIAILVFMQDIYTDLIPWTHWKEEEAWGDQVVPYVEAGHPGPISITLIDEVLCLTLKKDQNSFWSKIRSARSVST